MPTSRVITLTLLAMPAFAGNSLLRRAAFHATRIDAASFTSIRLTSGAHEARRLTIPRCEVALSST
jgi:hypothetical protein